MHMRFTNAIPRHSIYISLYIFLQIRPIIQKSLPPRATRFPFARIIHSVLPPHDRKTQHTLYIYIRGLRFRYVYMSYIKRAGSARLGKILGKGETNGAEAYMAERRPGSGKKRSR